MTSKLLIAGVAAGCVTAAGVGGFLAVRMAPDPAVVSMGPAEAAVAAAAPVVAAPAPPTAVVAAAPLAGTPARSVSSPLPARVSQARAAVPVPTQATVNETPAAAPATNPPPALSVPVSEPAAVPVHPGPPVGLEEPRISLVEVPADAVIGIRLDTTVSTESAKVEDPVQARVTRPVVVDGVAVIPTGARLRGYVTLVEAGGRFRERARIEIRFTSLSVDNETYVPISTEALYREGEPPTSEATAKIGASAVVGSILGGVFGGRKGAAIGAATGAAGGTAVVATGGRNEATLLSGTTFTVRLSEPVTVAQAR